MQALNKVNSDAARHETQDRHELVRVVASLLLHVQVIQVSLDILGLVQEYFHNHTVLALLHKRVQGLGLVFYGVLLLQAVGEV